MIRPLVTSPRRLAHVAASGGMRVDARLKSFVEDKVLPGTGIGAGRFWDGLRSILEDLAPRNRALLQRRNALQAEIDAWHKAHPGVAGTAYTAMLRDCGYLAPDAPPFEVATRNVDPEIARVAGPQLVCPVDNARFIVNAANARWGSLLDAIYGTDVLEGDRSGPYNKQRGAAAFDKAHSLLDQIFPLDGAQWSQVTALSIHSRADGSSRLEATLSAGQNSAPPSPDHKTVETKTTGLRDASQLAGYLPGLASPRSVLLANHGLHLELLIDRSHPVGASHAAGVKDIQMESAMTAICDMEDSACTVDAEDKVVAYGNWLGLMKGDIAVPMQKGGVEVMRKLNPNRTWTCAATGGCLSLPGRAVLLARNVGIHMFTDAVTMPATRKQNGAPPGQGGEDGGDGEHVPAPEGIVDAMVTAAAALHDLNGRSGLVNSKAGSLYIVKPKMHGPEEGDFVVELFGRVEDVLGMPRNTIKIGVMDEERRTTLNLRQMMRATRDRLFFINTGFLDRTADEIHTSMEAGPVLPKAGFKAAPWFNAYEAHNVDCGVATGLLGRGQIGKGMWAAPDDMAKMLRDKGAQLAAGASTAWVPSPTAATLHALHYHLTSVAAVQAGMRAVAPAIEERRITHAEAIMTLPLLADPASLGKDEVQWELDNNAQGLLGYVVRWVGQGVGCSKVPDLHDVQLMEDRATLRISSQHVANWLHHGVVTQAQVLETLKRMAAIVDQQNAGGAGYKPLAPAYDSPEWHAALDLIFKGRQAPNGYTEDTLSHWRRVRKAMDASGP